MKKRIAFCFVAAFVSTFSLAACGGGDEGQQKAQQEQQKTQQEPTQQAAQTTPTTTQSSDLAARLIGTWDATSLQGNSVPQGTQTITFSADGALQSTSNTGSPGNSFTGGQYSVLDDSRIQLTNPDGTSAVANYSLEGDTLTLELQGVPVTYQRTS